MKTPVCRSCRADSNKQKVRADFVFGGEKKHKFWQCEVCGLVYLWPIPSEKAEAYFYAKEFEKYMSSRTGSGCDWSGAESHIKANQTQVKRRWEFLKDKLKPKKNILEIGCSSGFMLDAFRKTGLNIVGIEPSKKFLKFLGHKKYTVFGSMEELKEKMPEKKFDLIVHFFVLEHIRDTEKFIKEQLDLLKPFGEIIAEVPCVNDPLTSVYKISAFEKFYWSIAHHYYFSPKSLSIILDRIGCKYKFVPEQRYDLSNHLVWMQDGKPGGQGRYNHIFSKKTLENYVKDLKNNWCCDTFFVYIKK